MAVASAWLGSAAAVNFLPRPASVGPDDMENYWNCGARPRTAPEKCPNDIRCRTPHIDRLFDEATVFTFAHASAPVCAPSRYSALTDHTSGIFGKWHLSELSDARPYDQLRQDALDAGFDVAEAFSFTNQAVHNPEWTVSEAGKFMRDAAQAGTPFFAYFNPTLPHSPGIPITEAGLERIKYAEARLEEVGAGDLQQFIKVTFVDESFGALRRGLEAVEAFDDTLVAFHLDHDVGYASDRINTVKGTMDGMSIALFLRGPSFGTVHAVRPDLVCNLDLGPTFAAIAGISYTGVEGKSLLETSALVARTIYVEFKGDRAAGTGAQISRAHRRVIATSPELPEGACYLQVCDGGETLEETLETGNVDVTSNPAFDAGKARLKSLLECHNAPTGTPCAAGVEVGPTFTLESGDEAAAPAPAPTSAAPTPTAPTPALTPAPTLAPVACVSCQTCGLNGQPCSTCVHQNQAGEFRCVVAARTQDCILSNRGEEC
ncbi:alkaline-phosphatase-like protein [Pelagophyceae sp. CCMP2097]|nr:alkaline-phosphatase-like protein [Pelagophyceae sp. CCMP2097]